MRIIGIRRDAAYSPNMSDADTAIFEAVATRLEVLGHEVTRLSDADFLNAFPDDNPTFDPAMERCVEEAERIFTMSRNALTCCLLDVVERFDHIPCVNAGRGVSICANRHQLSLEMNALNVPQPPTCFGSLYEERLANDPVDACELVTTLRYPVWIKRCFEHTQVKEDVVLVADVEDAITTLGAFARAGVGEVAFCQHVEGDLVKFYGVAGTGFFDWDYADPAHSKFGLEVANGSPHGYPFRADLLQKACERLATAIGVPVYGGDAVVQTDGTFCIIDFNDWPSFSRCREQAADAIAKVIANEE